MEIIYQTGFIITIFLLVIILHKWIGKYPDPLPGSDNKGKETLVTLIIWSVAVLLPIFRIFLLDSWLKEFISDRFLYELAYCPVALIAYCLIPGYIILKRDKRSLSDLGIRWKTKSVSVVIFALSLGFLSGIIAYSTGQSVISDDPISAGTLLLLLINNDFAEEFFHRGIIQSKLERLFGQQKAIIFGGILFGLTHIAFDITQLLDTGIIFVFFAFLLQTMLGWLLGIIFIKTRSLWPGIVLHFLVNWLPSILGGLFG